MAIFLLPVSPSLDLNKDGHLALGVKTNEAKAEDYTNLFPGSTVKWLSGSSSTAEFDVNIIGVQTDWNKVYYIKANNQLGIKSKNENSTVLVVMENGNYVSSYDLSGEVLVNTTRTGFIGFYSWVGPLNITGWKSVLNLTPEKTYTADLYVQSLSVGDGGGINLFGSTKKNYYKFGTGTSFTTPKEGDLLTGDTTTPKPDDTSAPNDSSFYECERITSIPLLNAINVIDLPCQFTRVMYYLIFVPLSWIAGFAGRVMDYFIYYSTNSDSYTSNFVGKAWGAVRDIANIFFIIALLYVAIKTILSLNVTNNKKIIGTIIIVALLINFSLFFTEVIIDGSNILAKVFYNNIDVQNQDKTTANTTNGAKSISAGLVKNFDPQKVFNDADIHKMTDNLSLFFLLVLLMSAISAFMIFMFFSVALLFVARVVGLWLAMVFAPIAFASYTMPFEIPGFGHKKWWENLLKQAFLAPIFIFFLYVIYLFSNAIKDSVKDVNISTGNGLEAFMKVIIPMAIIFIMLQQAKKLAVDYSGDIGKAVMSAGKMVGGLALGAATGGVAMAGRATVGRAGSMLANSKFADRMSNSKNSFVRGLGNKTKDIGEATSKKSFDVRKVKIAGKDLAGVTGMSLGKGKEGGFEGAKKRKDEKREARKKQLEERGTKGDKKSIDEAESKLNQSHNDHQNLKDNLAPELSKLDTSIDRLGKEFSEKSKKSQASGSLQDRTETEKAYMELQNAKEQRSALINGGKYEKTVLDENGKPVMVKSGKKKMVTKTRTEYEKDAQGHEILGKGKTVTYQEAGDEEEMVEKKEEMKTTNANGKSLHGLELETKEQQWNVAQKKQTMAANKRQITMNYADDIDSGFNKTLNMVTSMGQYSIKGGKQTAERMKRVQRIGSSGGGDTGSLVQNVQNAVQPNQNAGPKTDLHIKT